MHYFKDSQNQIFAYDDKQVAQGCGEDLTPITEAEKDFLLAPTPEQLKQQRISEIHARLAQIDSESVRPLRAINAGTQTQFDTDRLAELDAEAETLRQELAELVNT